MKKLIGYKCGYRIVIQDGFYEVLDGKTAKYYGSCRKNSTIQEIINKTIDQEGDSVDTRNCRVMRRTISGRCGSRDSINDGEDKAVM